MNIGHDLWESTSESGQCVINLINPIFFPWWHDIDKLPLLHNEPRMKYETVVIPGLDMVNLFSLGCTSSSRTICTTAWAQVMLSDNLITACSMILWVLAKWLFLHLALMKKNINQLCLLTSLRAEGALFHVFGCV